MEIIELKGLKETIYYDECANGLKVFMWVNKRVNTFYGTLSVKYGSVYNKFKVGSKSFEVPKGVAHFLEHIKFNEDANTTAHDYFFKNGCDTNAFTTFKYTNYQVFGSDNAKDNVLHLLDFVENPYFTKKMINNEKGIITEEAKMGEDDPYTAMLFKHLDSLFVNSDYKYLITGTPDDIKNITIEDILLVYNTFYHPENMFLTITGNFNPYELMDAIKDNQNKKEFSKYTRPKRIAEKEPKNVKDEYLEINTGVTSPKIKIGLKIPKSNFKDLDDLHIRLYSYILLKACFGSTSEFKDELLMKELINNMGYMCEIFDDYLIVMFTIDTPYKDEIISLFKEKLTNLKIEKKDFKRIIKASIASLILDYDDVETVNEQIQNEIINYGKITDDYKEIYENLDFDDMVKFIHAFDPKNNSTIIFLPLS